MQPTHAGWYWDPTGRPGLFRWWDGVVWTRHVTPDRTDPAPEPLRLADADADGLLHAGRLAFPLLPDPWRQCPAYPGFTEAVAQERGVGRTGRGEYDALVVIGSVPERLQVGSSQEIAETLCAEILSTFYPAERPAGPTTGIEVEVDGQPGWRLDVRLDVDDPALDFAREDLLLVVLAPSTSSGRDAGDSGSAVLYASLPDSPGVPAADDIVDQLRVFVD